MVYFWQQPLRPPRATSWTPFPSLSTLPLSALPTRTSLSALSAGSETPMAKTHRRPVCTSSSVHSLDHNPIDHRNIRLHTGAITQDRMDSRHVSSRRQHEADTRRGAERELINLNLKIEKLLLKMEDSEGGRKPTRKEDECVVCLTAGATMQTFPCGHRVVCRTCLIKTIQVAVLRRCLPLRCVVCRDRILSIQQGTDPPASTQSSSVIRPHLHRSTSAAHSNIKVGHCTPTSPLSPTGHHTPTSPLSLTHRHTPTSPLTPTSLTGLFSLITGPRYGNSLTRAVWPVSSSDHGLTQLTSSVSEPSDMRINTTSTIPILDNKPTVVHLSQSSPEEELSHFNHRYKVKFKDFRTVVFNRHTVTTTQHRPPQPPPVVPGASRDTAPHRHAVTTPQPPPVVPCASRETAPHKHAVTTPQPPPVVPCASRETSLHRHAVTTPQDNRLVHTHGRQHATASSASKFESAPNNFLPTQTVKVHPTSHDHLISFMNSPTAEGTLSPNPPTIGPNNPTRKSSRAAKFLAKLLPKSSRRSCSWFQPE